MRRISELFEIIKADKAIIETFGELKALLQKDGNVLHDPDLLIGATALALNCKLVTNNEKRFSGIPGLLIENWTI